MKNATTNSQSSSNTVTPQDLGFSPWQRLKSKRISYLTLPLLAMATVTEFVILATGWKYQKTVCLPTGMGVTFFGIGPIGATILAVELLKLPLAIWTASRRGWAKVFMLTVGLPLICVLTFQLVKDMAVYEMGVAMTPASQMLEKAMAEDIKAAQLTGDLAAIEQKKAERQQKLAELAAKRNKAKAEIEEALKFNDESRQDAISLTDFQKKELSEVEARQAAIIKQSDADTAQLTKAIADLHARRETELGRATKWNNEEARIENAYKAAMFEYANKKAAYEKAKTQYDNASFLKRQLLATPIDPGVPPVRESNTILKPTAIAELDEQIKAKEAELLAVNNKRRDRVAQVEADARRVREEYDKRSITRREKTDTKREELAATQAALLAELNAEEKKVDQEVTAAVQKVDGIRAEVDAARKRAQGFYEAREASIRKTQVHRIATTVEIVRGLIRGERPMSIKATAKERGDILTDQISMVRIWVYPVLAFIVAFLPTLMVEIGFTTVFEPEHQRPPHRLGFFGRRLHWLYTRAGRQKILHAERMAREASTQIAARDEALAAEKAAAEKALAEKEAEVQAAREAIGVAAAEHEEQLKKKEEEWVAKLAGMADSLNRSIIEKDALRDLQKSEVERQIQMRQHAWSDRLTQMRQELDEQRTAAENERTTLMQEHHKKLMEVTEDCKNQIIQVRRQMADAELAAVEASAKMAHDLKEALSARDTAETQLKRQAESFSTQFTQAKDDAARELEKAVRQERHRLERQHSELEKALRQRDDDFEHRLKQREQELSLAFDARLVEEKTKVEQQARRREAELERQLESRAREVEARWKQELQQQEEVVQTKLKKREQQLQAQAEARLSELQAEAEKALRQRDEDSEHRLKQREQELSVAFEARLVEEKAKVEQAAARREAELERQFEARAREVDARWKQDAQQREEVAQAKLKKREQQLQAQAELRISGIQTEAEKALRQREEDFEHALKQREQELSVALDARLAEEKAKVEQDARRREEDLEGQLEARAREVEARWKQELQQREEAAQTRLKKREQQLQAQAEARISQIQTEAEEAVRCRELELERQLEARSREAETRLREEVQQKDLAFHAKLKQREQELNAKATARETELQNQWAADLRARQEEWEHQAESRVHAAETRLAHEAQQKEEILQMKIRQREQQLQSQLDARQAELRAQWEQDLRGREQEWERKAEATVRAAEARWITELQQKEEQFQTKSRQRDQQWQAKLEAARAEMQAQTEQELRRREAESADARSRAIRELEAKLRNEMQQKDEAAQAAAKQREQDVVARLAAQAEAHQMAKTEWETEFEKMRGTIEPLEALVVRTERERDEARQAAAESTRRLQDLERKLSDASSLLTGWKSGNGNGKPLVGRAA